MAIDIEKFRAYLAQDKVQVRFRLEYDVADIKTMLEETYRYKVSIRKRVYKPDKTLPIIGKVAKWATTDLKPGLLLYGTIGSGKSTMSDSLARVIGILNPSMAIFRSSAIDIANAARDDKDKFESIKTSKVLFIDDLGEEEQVVKNFGNNISPLVEVLYYRYDKQLFTVITTNKLESEIGGIYGARIEDRFAEMFDRIYFDFPSFRRI